MPAFGQFISSDASMWSPPTLERVMRCADVRSLQARTRGALVSPCALAMRALVRTRERKGVLFTAVFGRLLGRTFVTLLKLKPSMDDDICCVKKTRSSVSRCCVVLGRGIKSRPSAHMNRRKLLPLDHCMIVSRFRFLYNLLIPFSRPTSLPLALGLQPLA